MRSSSYRPVSPLYRLISAALVVTQLMTLTPVPLWAATSPSPAADEATSQPAAAPRPHAAPPPPVTATVNTTRPVVGREVPAIGFSANPSDAELGRCRLFAEPLLPIGGKTSPGENQALAAAILEFSHQPTADHVQPLKAFLAAHPQSPWSVSLLTNLGIIARAGCDWSEALADWRAAWETGKDEKGATRKMIVDRALGQWIELTARIGRVKELKAMLAIADDRHVRGPSVEKIAEARQSLYLEENEPTKSFRCGPMAAGKLWGVVNPGKPVPTAVFDSVCTEHGTSLTQVKAFAKSIGLELQMAKRSPGAPVILPSIVNWKVGHFAALTKRFESGQYEVQDPTFSEDFAVSKQTLDKEASGYFLVRAGELPKGWQKVSEAEGANVWGKGAVAPHTPPTPPCTGPIISCKNCKNHAMAGYAIDPSRVNLTLSDTPLFYSPPHGPAIEFTASYSQRDIAPSSTPNYPNLGAQWNFNWVSFVVDDPNNAKTLTYGPGGGVLAYTGYTSTGANTGSFASQALTQCILQRTSATSYVKSFADGSRQVFGLADNSTPRKIYMTEYDDPAGNALTYTYDPATFRLLSVTDSLGQVTTLAYVSNDPAAVNGDFYRVASVTDPFGRSASLAYDGEGRLSQTTDMGGGTSQFTYGAGDFISTLTTPYGNTTFVSNDSGPDRTLLVTDPEGGNEFVQFKYNMIPPDSGSTVPSATGLLTQPGYNQYRTTYYWDKKAYMQAPGDYSKAHLYHFLHTSDLSSMSDILESEKRAYESRVYYNYPGQTNGYTSSNNNQPSMIARVLDDGSTQLTQMTYNGNGKLAKIISPGNATTPSRTATFSYATNGIDLTAAYQEDPAGPSTDSFNANADLLASFTYDTGGKHLVTAATDASGQTTHCTYNSYGQVLTMTDAKNKTTTFTYDRDQDSDGLTDGYLKDITGPVAGATAHVKFDGFGRPYQFTDSEGYVVTVTYDAIDGVPAKTLNRVATVTYPDGTTEHTTYDRLDPQWHQDRMGRWTETIHDNMRRVAVVLDPLSRITQYQWCACGSLEAIIDPAGNRTSWMRDEQRRIIQKTYPDGTTETYKYENTTSRLKSALDAKGQQKNYQYSIDNSLKQITYTNASGGALTPPTPGVSYTYDTVFPRIASTTDGVGTTQYGYNPITVPPQLGAGKLATVGGLWANDTVSYTYDELGRINGRSIDGAANAASVLYDDLGRVSSVTDLLGTFNFAYVNATERLDNISYPNGQIVQYHYYDNLGDQRLQQIKNQDSGGNLISQFDYTYNGDGSIQSWTLNNPGLANPRQYVFGYDPADQLTAATLSDTGTSGIVSDQAYRYDPAGNRVTTQSGNVLSTAQFNSTNQLSQTSGGGLMRFAGSVNRASTVTVGGNPAAMDSTNTKFQGYANVSANTTTRVHIVATDSESHVTDNYADITPDLVTGRAYSYDFNGNTTSVGPSGSPIATYGWDAANRLISVTQGTTVTTFDYDGQGRRVRKKVNGTETCHWIWDGLELCEERDALNNVTKRFFSQGEQLGGTAYYSTQDHLGSVRELTDSTGILRARYDYDIYGQRSPNQVTGMNAVGSDFGFTGHQEFQFTNLELLGAPYRFYQTDQGRWLSRDPIRERGGMNLYGYAGNSPTNLTDPSGLYFLGTFVIGGIMYGLERQLFIDHLQEIEDAWDGCDSGVQPMSEAQVAQWIDLAVALGTLADFVPFRLGGGCFLPGTPIEENSGERPIEQVHLGDRVITTDHAHQESATGVDPQNWRLVRLKAANVDGSSDGMDLAFLRSMQWLKEEKAEIGSEIWLNIPEIGFSGWARVDAIESCPTIRAGVGRVVTGTITRLNSSVLQLHFEGTAGTLSPTQSHRLYSETRHAWVSAGRLQKGELLKTESGSLRLSSVEKIPGMHRVYNIEVEADHCYFVGNERVLSHNACGGLTPQEIDEIQNIADRYDVEIDVVGSRARGEGNNIDTDLPVGHDPGTQRSDIDFKFDARHPASDDIVDELKDVGNGAGSADPKYSTHLKDTRAPYIRFTPKKY